MRCSSGRRHGEVGGVSLRNSAVLLFNIKLFAAPPEQTATSGGRRFHRETFDLFPLLAGAQKVFVPSASHDVVLAVSSAISLQILIGNSGLEN